MNTEYVLGNDPEELARLRLQHNLWRGELVKLWDFSRLNQSEKVLELGCGPGFTSLDFLQYNLKCSLTSVDISDTFLQYLQHQAKTLHLETRLKTHNSYIEDLSLEEKKFDAVFCRWLMIFVKDPKKAIEQVHLHLKSGGEFVIQEYIRYDTMDLVPDYKMMRPVVEAIFKSWFDQGGDPNRGRHLPDLLSRSGFRIKRLEPILKFATPEDPLWQWPESFYKVYLPKLQKGGYLSDTQVRDFFQEWEAAKTSPGSFFVGPTLINIIAEKL